MTQTSATQPRDPESQPSAPATKAPSEEKALSVGRTPYDAVVEIVRLLGRAGPYAVFLVIILYAIQQIVVANNDKLEQVNKARTEALEKNAADITRLNQTV